MPDSVLKVCLEKCCVTVVPDSTVPHTTPLGPRPTPLVVEDDAPLRHDVRSEEMDIVHPEIKYMKTPEERMSHVRRCDGDAYRSLRDSVDFRPPHT